MTPDRSYALGLGVASLSLLIPAIRYPVLEAISHPVLILLGVFVIVWTLSLGMRLTAVVLIALALYLLRSWSTHQGSVERKVYLAQREADARFNPWYSVDLQVANRTLVHEAPQMLQTDRDATPLLKFPPSQATLAELSGH